MGDIFGSQLIDSMKFFDRKSSICSLSERHFENVAYNDALIIDE